MPNALTSAVGHPVSIISTISTIKPYSMVAIGLQKITLPAWPNITMGVLLWGLICHDESRVAGALGTAHL